MAKELAVLSIAASEILGWDQGRQGLFVSFQFPPFKSHASFKAAVEFHTGRQNVHGRGKKALTRFTSLFLPIIIAFDLLLHPLSILILFRQTLPYGFPDNRLHNQPSLLLRLGFHILLAAFPKNSPMVTDAVLALHTASGNLYLFSCDIILLP